jgi:hypothetical protein
MRLGALAALRPSVAIDISMPEAFQRHNTPSSTGNLDVEGSSNDCREAQDLEKPKRNLGLSSETNSPGNAGLSGFQQGAPQQIQARRAWQIARYGHLAATCCGDPARPGGLGGIPFGKLESENCVGGVVREGCERSVARDASRMGCCTLRLY